MKKEEFIEELETLILNNEDDFDRGKGKFILREFISSLKSSDCKDKTPKVITNEDNGKVCVLCGMKFLSKNEGDNCCDECWLEIV